MATTKSQLPMIRSLKAIARRKANTSYYDIPVPAEVNQRLKDQAKAAKKELNRAMRALLRGQTKSLLMSLILEQNSVPLSPVEEGQVTAFKAARDHLFEVAGSTRTSDLVYVWQKDQKKKAEELFGELENIELQVIAGESVDLAPYTRLLQN